MAALNIVRVAVLNGKMAVANVNTTPSSIVTNATNSNLLFKINTVSFCNYASSTANVSMDLLRSGVGYRIVANVSVPVNSSFVAVTKDSMLYLEEGDSLRVYAGANNVIEAVVSYDYLA